jgi:hypothetical protein
MAIRKDDEIILAQRASDAASRLGPAMRAAKRGNFPQALTAADIVAQIVVMAEISKSVKQMNMQRKKLLN